jgi:hypothetical protein
MTGTTGITTGCGTEIGTGTLTGTWIAVGGGISQGVGITGMETDGMIGTTTGCRMISKTFLSPFPKTTRTSLADEKEALTMWKILKKFPE